ncbi:MAG TPA: YARHG domain-containing protein [Gemmatimonadaceae bacterium]
MIRRRMGVIALAVIVVGCAQKPKPNADTGAAQAGRTTAAAGTPAPPPKSMDDWERFDYSAHTVAQASLASLPLVDVQRIRGIIFGRHGRVFQDSTLQAWLATRSWYHADTTFTNARLTSGERANLEVVREAEATKHTQIEPGDMRFYQNRVITTAMLGDHSPQDWEVLEAEVLANHGYVFATEDESDEVGKNRMLATDDLQHYFDERYWYKTDTGFQAAALSAIEKQNLDTIALAVMRRSKRSVSPGLMNLFQSTPLTEPMLTNVSINDLRLLRNEVYARHGRPFQTAWLAEYFRSEPWYKPNKDFSDAELSATERANIALITKREEELHQSLGTRLLTVADVQGLIPEDARRLRNEIYARHWRRFQDPKLQRYFASFAWYKPSDAFRESQLNAAERANAALISQYEHGKFTEG